MLDVVTVFAPRPEYPHWPEYLPLLDLQRRTVEKFAHRHVVVSDANIAGLNVLHAALPVSLMHLQLEGQLAYLKQWSGAHPVVLVDTDVLIARDLNEAFDGSFDIGLTNRDNPVAPINNGAMYLAAGAKEAALRFFTQALALCKAHWGGDQEAIGQAAAPVPKRNCIKRRCGCRMAFLDMRLYNVTPRKEGAKHQRGPFVVHFKGDRKGWMKTYAEQFILATS